MAMKKVFGLTAVSLVAASMVVGGIAQARSQWHKIIVEGKKRRFKVILPESCKDTKKLPVVLLLHGAGSNPSTIEWVSKMSRLAREKKFIVVYPQGSGYPFGLLRTWNAGIECGPAYKKSVNDVQFLSSLIDEVNKRYPTDKNRVFVAGMSNGGMMAYRAANELSDKINAIGVVEASMFCNKPDDGKSVNLIAIHGNQDKVIPFNGGNGFWYGYKFKSPSVAKTLSYWVKRNGCSPYAEVEEADGYSKFTYRSEKNGSQVVFYLLDKAGHSWPGAIGIPPLISPSKKLSASEALCEFFLSCKPKIKEEKITEHHQF